MTRPQNPYIAGNPISDHDRFIGRDDVMRETLRILRNPNTNAIVLHGQRRIGKTSILLRLEKDLTGDEYCPVYFDLQDKAAAQLGDVLYQLAQTIAQSAHVDLPGRTQFDNEGNFFRTQFLPDAAQHTAPRTLVLLFDEFDVLDLPQEGQAGSAFFPYLRAWMAQTLEVKFVFVLGRRPEELSTDTLATFKATQSDQVSLISQSETIEIARLSERNQSLYWNEGALDRIWQWTQGHPYLTQLLCSEIWEAAYDDEPTDPPTIEAEDVGESVEDALEQGANAFQWIWNGLPHAERVVMAAMAAEKSETISQHQLTELLNHSGVRLILRELELAPETLEKWDLLRRVGDENQSDDEVYRFAIPLLKRWVQQNKPLRRVKAELDSIEPLAMSLYQSAQGIYGMDDLDGAEELLTRALGVNPNHMQSRLLLGRVQLGKGNPDAAVATLEPAYEFDPPVARQDYIAALLARAEGEIKVDQRINTYTRILAIEPDQPVAKERWSALWQQEANEALNTKNYVDALYAYQQLGDQAAISRVSILQRKAQLKHLVMTAEKHEKEEHWIQTVEIYTQLLAEFPDEEDWQKRLVHANEEANLANLYIQAVGLIQEKKMDVAVELLRQVIHCRPDYKESARYLLIALEGDDVTSLKENLEVITVQRDSLQKKLSATTKKNTIQQAQITSLEMELVRLPSESDLTIERKLIIWNPLNHLRLLWWVLIQPKTFKRYRDSFNNSQTIQLKYLAAWTSSTLSWGTLGIYGVWGITQNSLPQGNPIALYTTVAVVFFAWFLTGRYGHLEESDRVFSVAFAGAVTAAFAVTVSVATAFPAGVTFTFALAFSIIVALNRWLESEVVFAVSVSVSTEGAILVAFAEAFAEAFTGAYAVEIGLMATAWGIVWLKLSQGEWLLRSGTGITVGVGCGGTILWLSGRLAALSPVQGVISIGIGIVAAVVIYFIILGIRDSLNDLISKA